MNINSIKYEPINQAHAISEMVVYIEFISDFDASRVELFRSLKDKLSVDLPKYAEIEEHLIPVGKNAEHSPLKRIVGIEMSHILSNGKPSWVLKTLPRSISIHCLDYTRWNEVWEKAYALILKVFSEADINENSISGFGLKYVDRFILKTNEQYFASELFNKESNLLHEKAFLSGDRWHCHIGWFENIPDGELQGLNQLNIDVGYADVDSTKKHLSTIDHSITVRKIDDDNFISLEKGTDRVDICSVYNKLHESNKLILSELLVDSMRKSISLDNIER